MDRDNANGSFNEAWAAGGWLYARSGFWRDVLQFGATYYFSVPVYAPADGGGTQLLAPGQNSISVVGELYARMRYEQQRLTLYRQEIDMGYKRPAGVRANHSDLAHEGRLDNRMVPLTYDAARLGGPLAQEHPSVGLLGYWAGYLWDAKPRDSNSFVSMGEAIGAKDSGAGMSMAGLQWSPVKDLWAQAWYHRVNDVLAIAFLDADDVGRLDGQSYWRRATQYSSQTSAGGSALTGQRFSTWNWEAYGEYGWQWLNVYGAYSTVGQAQQIRTPFSSGPIYTQMVTRSFTRAGQDTVLLGVALKLDALLTGLSMWVDVGRCGRWPQRRRSRHGHAFGRRARDRRRHRLDLPRQGLEVRRRAHALAQRLGVRLRGQRYAVRHGPAPGHQLADRSALNMSGRFTPNAEADMSACRSVASPWPQRFILAGVLLLAVCASLQPPPADRIATAAITETTDTRLGLAVAPLVAAHPGRSGVHQFPQPHDAFAARALLAQAAQKSLDAQYFIWHDDPVGRLVFQALWHAAERGVRVRLLLDDASTTGLDPTLAALDAHPNIELRLRNPFAYRGSRAIGYLTDFQRLNRRMHNKPFTADLSSPRPAAH